jgi:hypothetical protein
MPIDPVILNAVLDTFKNMYGQCSSQNPENEHVKSMGQVLDRFEQLGQEHSDFNAFNAQVAQENLYAQFSDFYTRALTDQNSGSAQANDGEYDDASLLASCVQGLKQAISVIEDSYQQAIDEGGKNNNGAEVEILQNPQDVIKPIQQLVELGEQQGMTLPDYLRIQIEKGLDKAMEGSVVLKNSLELEKQFVETNPVSPYHIQKADKKIEVFEMLASAAKFGVPDSKQWSVESDDIDRSFEGNIIKYKKIKEMWERMLDNLSDWSLSYTSFAPYIEPWNMSANPKEATIETQNILPGVFTEREKLLQYYFGIGFFDIFKHETFLWEVKYNYLGYSQEFVEFLIKEVYPQCKPLQHLPSEIIEKRAMYSRHGSGKKDKESNPQKTQPAQRLKTFYDKTFGEGRYEQKFGRIPEFPDGAAPWDIDKFEI